MHHYAAASLALAISALVLLSGARNAPALNPVEPASVETPTGEETSSWFEDFGDPLPVTTLIEKEESRPVDLEWLKLVGRIAKGVRKVGLSKGGGRWWECGVVYENPEQEEDASVQWAMRIVGLSEEYSDGDTDKGLDINPWEVSGVIANECGFDRCALGKWPRKWGYEHGTLKRNRRSISHTYSEIETTLNDPRAAELFRTTGLDGAPMHTLWRCEGKMCWLKWNREGLPSIPMRDVFSLGTGFEYNVRELKKRAIDNRTNTPSLYWRGYKCDWYLEKVQRWAKFMGAKKGEV